MTATWPDLPLRGARVLITRAADDAEPLSGRLRALGAEVILLPTLEIVPPADLGALDRALHALDRYHWIAFTSRHAVDAVFGRLIELGLPAPAPMLRPQTIAHHGAAAALRVYDLANVRVGCAP